MANASQRFGVFFLTGVMWAAPAFARGIPPEPEQKRICLRAPVSSAVPFRGTVTYDKAGSKAGGMVYPAPGLVGLIAAVATHAAVSATVRESEKQKLREESDAVLAPYLGVLGTYRHDDLMRASLPVMKSSGDKRVIALDATNAADELLIDTSPTFYLTQDQRAIIVENAIRIERAAGGTYEKVIRVISPVQAKGAGTALWLADDASLLKAESARIYALSLDIAVDDLGTQIESSEPFRTVRYAEGGTEKMERAQVIAQECSHLVLRTLRGDILAVPQKPANADCRI